MAVHSMGCPGCGGPFVQEDRFCRFCGLSLAAGPSRPERRFVTALYSDLCGYTALCALMDQEELKTVLDSVFRESSRIVSSLGGTVEKFLGDGVVALFGLRRTREDDLIRAVKAASLIHEAAARRCLPQGRLAMHTGIHAGAVLVEGVPEGSPSLGAMGMPINVAARLSGLAGPGEILLAGDCIHEAERFFLTEPLGPKKLKGIDRGMPVYRVLSPKAAPSGVHRPGGAPTPLVGRTSQLEALRQGYRSRMAGEGGALLITGMPGAGKSRLALELLNGLPREARAVTVHCLDHMKDIPYHPAVSLIRQLVLPGGEDLPGLDSALGGLLGNPRHAFHLRLLLGMGQGHGTPMPDVWKSEITEAMVTLVAALAREGPLVVCVEDFHWADASSRDLFLALARPGGPRGFVLVATSRERDLPGEKFLRVEAEELAPEHMAPLLQALLPGGRVPDAAAASLHRVTGGNPLYIEEYLSYLGDRGMSPLQGFAGDVPSTVQGIIMARLEALPPSGRALLHAASAAGVIFPEALLRAMSPVGQGFDDGLRALVEAGFLTAGQSGECSFRHALTREAAYASLVSHRRRELHLEIALWLQERGGNSSQDCGKVAYHLFHAREYARACPWCLLSARRYQAEGSLMEAAAHYARARECILRAGPPENREELLIAVCEGIWSCSRIFNPGQAIEALEELASLHSLAGQTDQELFARIRLINLYAQKALFGKAFETFDAVSPRTQGSGFLAAAAGTAAGYTCTFLGRPLEALRRLEEARSRLDEPDSFLLMANHLATLAACVWKGDVRGALAWYARTKETSGPYLDFDLMAEVWLGYVLFLKGEISRGEQVLEGVRVRERELGSLAGGFSYLRSQSSIYLCTRYTGDLDRAREDLAMARAQGADEAHHAPLFGIYRAWIALESGAHREAAELAREVIPSLETGIANRVPYALNTLAEALSLLGDLGPAEEAALRGVRWNTEHGNADQLIWALRVLADVLLAQGRNDACRESLCRASFLAHGSGMAPHAAWSLASWGSYHAALGNVRKAGACFNRAKALWTSMGCPHQAGKVASRQTPGTNG